MSPIVVLAKARTHTAESLRSIRWWTIIARTVACGYGSWLSPGRRDESCAFDSRTALLRHVWTAPSRQGLFCVSANGSGSGHVYGLEKRPLTAGPDGDRGPNSNHCGAL